MSQDPRLFTPIFSIDVSADPTTVAASNKIDANELIVGLLKQLVDGQQREIKLLEEVAHFVGVHHNRGVCEIIRCWYIRCPCARAHLVSA